MEMFNESNGEHIGVFSKIEPLLPEIRNAYGPQFAISLEKLINAMPDGHQRVAATRERFKAIRARMEQQSARPA